MAAVCSGISLFMLALTRGFTLKVNQTALHIAVDRDRTEAIGLLLVYGACINACDKVCTINIY